ncbi:DUF4190 domain-containing protein [Paenibacillus tengchongensis]|uniref:DUF4190 domain-containing protein n=1 Tax=Paenibacillus tengchongensis TaxID=2608684 RepID=UPI00124C0316|nr:DUF4190 domain-containing protein [Paenibacillus tengchongensis]
MVLGILAIVIPWIGMVLGIIAIFLAALAFKELNRRRERSHGLAIAGLVCGIIGTLFV